MQNLQDPAQEIDALEAAAVRAAQSGQEEEATAALEPHPRPSIPNHVRTLTALGQRAFRQGDMQSARTAFQRIVDIDGSDAQQWIHLAVTCRNLSDARGRREGDSARAEPRSDRSRGADSSRRPARAAGENARGRRRPRPRSRPSLPRSTALRPELRPAVARAVAHVESYNKRYGAFLDEYLEPRFAEFAGENLKRFRDSVDIMVGRKKRFDSQSLIYHYPHLAPIEFFDRAEFPLARSDRGRHRRDPGGIPGDPSRR